MSRTRTWTIGTAVAVALVLIAGTFLLVMPKRSQTAEFKQETVAQEQTNIGLQQRIDTLKAQQANLPAQQAELAQIQQQLPETPNLPALIRSLSAAAVTAGVQLTTLTPAVPEAVAAPAVAAPQAPSAGAAAAEPGSAAPGGAAPAPATGANTAGLQRMPLTIVVKGSYAELTQFTSQLEGLRRAMLVTGIAMAPPENRDDPGYVMTIKSGVYISGPLESVVAPAAAQTGATSAAGSPSATSTVS